MSGVVFNKNPSNLTKPLRVNPKYSVKEEDFIQPYSDKVFYDNLKEFNRVKLKQHSGDYYQTYMRYKDKAYENDDYKKLTSSSGDDFTYDNYHEKQFIKSLASKRIYKIN